MNKLDFDALGDKHKRLESTFTGLSLTPGVPYIIRLDGRAFHTFTKNFERPFSDKIRDAMVETTKALVHHTRADIGYTQSDEITLGFFGGRDSMDFDGRVMKMATVLAGYCSVAFYKEISKNWMSNTYDLFPCFDARVWHVKNDETILENLLWRQQDAMRNSASMAAHAYFSVKELHKVGRSDQIKMLAAQGIDWHAYHYHYRHGTFVKKVPVLVDPANYPQDLIDKLSPEQLQKLPKEPFIRNRTVALDIDLQEFYRTQEDGVKFLKEYNG